MSGGGYLLRTNLVGWKPGDLWRIYVRLTDIEAALRTFKLGLVLRPLYHQIERRVHGHIPVAFLGYAMWKTLQKWMDAAGLGRGVATVAKELTRTRRSEAILPTNTRRGLKLHCITRPDKWQQSLLERMGLRNPVTWATQMEASGRDLLGR